MGSKIFLTIPGEPKAKQRPKWSPVGTYTPQKTLTYEAYIKELFVIKYPNFTLLQGELVIELKMFLTIPTSKSKKKKDLMREWLIRPTKIPDIDNVLKIVMDSLQSLAYKNDSQFIRGVVDKYYSDKPRLEINIY